jgi:hypothetical protein
VALNYAPTGVTLTLFKVGLYSKTGTLLASSADISGTIGAAAVKSVAFSTPYTVLTNDAYYLGVIAVFSAGTVALMRGTVSSLLSVALDGGLTPIVKQTGQTDIPSPATFVAGNNAQACFWMAAYK